MCVPLQRIGEFEDIARAILFVASDEASYISGAPNSRWTAVGRRHVLPGPAGPALATRGLSPAEAHWQRAGAAGRPARGGHNIRSVSPRSPARLHPISIPGVARTAHPPAWFVAVGAFLALVGAAIFRAAPSILIDRWHDTSLVPREHLRGGLGNLVLYGLDRTVRRSADGTLRHAASRGGSADAGRAGQRLTVFMTTTWQLILLWGVLVGLGTGSMALAVVATVVDRWFVARRGLSPAFSPRASARPARVLPALRPCPNATTGGRSRSPSPSPHSRGSRV